MESLTDEMINEQMGAPEMIQDEMIEITESGKTKDYTLYEIVTLINNYVLSAEQLEMWDSARINAGYDPEQKFDLDQMDEIKYRYCETCNYWVERNSEWERENETCIFCAENDEYYQAYLREDDKEGYDRYKDSL